MKAIFLATASCWPTARPPLHPRRGPLAGHVERPLAGADAHRGEGKAAGVQGREGDLEPLAQPADDVFRRHEHVVEAGDAVFQPAQAEELVAPLDRDALGVALHHERGDALVGHPRHHDDQRGDRAVGGPELDAIELVATLDRLGHGAEARRVGADIWLGEQERGDLTAGQPGQVLLLLLVGAEDLEWLRHADRLVRREERADRGVDRSGERERLAVVQIGQTEPTVLLVDLHAERAEPGQPLEDLVRDARLALDPSTVHIGPHVRVELGQELLGVGPLFGSRPGIDQVQPEAPEKELLAEARLAPLRLARGLGDLPGLLFRNGRGHG
jgi:hypothetical protein